MIAIAKRPLCWLIALGVFAGSLGTAEKALAAPGTIASEIKTLDREVAQLNAELKKKKKHHHHKHHHKKKSKTSASAGKSSKGSSAKASTPKKSTAKAGSKAKPSTSSVSKQNKPSGKKGHHHHHHHNLASELKTLDREVAQLNAELNKKKK
jgi:hypothetical protein